MSGRPPEQLHIHGLRQSGGAGDPRPPDQSGWLVVSRTVRFAAFILVSLASGAAPSFAENEQCAGSRTLSDPGTTPAWNGWGVDLSNSRFQPAKHAQLTASQVPQLKLKWAFGFPDTKSVLGQPSVVSGRVFLGVDTGKVYSLDASSGCLYWSFQAEAGVRTAIVVERSGTRYAAYFGDLKANAYAVDAATGKLLWKFPLDGHPSARITGAPKVFEGRVYFPIASGEEAAGANPKYACCTFRGSVTALDAATGGRLWKRYMIADKPRLAGKNSNGVALRPRRSGSMEFAHDRHPAPGSLRGHGGCVYGAGGEEVRRHSGAGPGFRRYPLVRAG